MGQQVSQGQQANKGKSVPQGCLACLGLLPTREQEETQEQRVKTARMGAQVRRALGEKKEIPERLVEWAKRVQLAAQDRQEGLAQLAKEERMALQGRLEPQAKKEVLARRVFLEM